MAARKKPTASAKPTRSLDEWMALAGDPTTDPAMLRQMLSTPIQGISDMNPIYSMVLQNPNLDPAGAIEVLSTWAQQIPCGGSDSAIYQHQALLARFFFDNPSFVIWTFTGQIDFDKLNDVVLTSVVATIFTSRQVIRQRETMLAVLTAALIEQAPTPMRHVAIVTDLLKRKDLHSDWDTKRGDKRCNAYNQLQGFIRWAVRENLGRDADALEQMRALARVAAVAEAKMTEAVGSDIGILVPGLSFLIDEQPS